METDAVAKTGTIRRIKRLIYRSRYVVALEVEATIYPRDDEAYLSAETCKLLDEVRQRAEAGDEAYLRGIGRVFRSL